MSGWYIMIPYGGTALQHLANKGFIRYDESCNVSRMKHLKITLMEKYALRQMCEICCLNKQSASTIIPRSRNSLTFSSWTPFRLYMGGILVPCVKTQHLCSAILSCQRSAHSMNWLRLSCYTLVMCSVICCMHVITNCVTCLSIYVVYGLRVWNKDLLLYYKKNCETVTYQLDWSSYSTTYSDRAEYNQAEVPRNQRRRMRAFGVYHT